MEKISSQVSSISGVFIYTTNPEKLSKWYSGLFGFKFNYWPENKSYGQEFIYTDKKIRHAVDELSTVIAFHPIDERHSGGTTNVKIQYRVENLKSFIQELKLKGITVDDYKEYSYGAFAWLTDPECNQVELYQPFGSIKSI